MHTNASTATHKSPVPVVSSVWDWFSQLLKRSLTLHGRNKPNRWLFSIRCRHCRTVLAVQ